MTSSSPLIPLGAMVGGPNGSDAVANALFESSFAGFTQTMGEQPTFMDAYVDQAKPISSWVDNAGWTAWSWHMSPSAQTTIPVIGLPMATNADYGNQLAVFNAFASGQHDDVLRGIVNAWGAQGFSQLYIRPGYEMNGAYMPWYMGDDPATQQAFVAAFRHIADVLHSVPGVDVKVVWNPNVQNWNAASMAAQYPGDSYVDVIAGDLYSPMTPRDLYDWARNDGTVDKTYAAWAANPVNRAHYWSYPAASQWAPQDDGAGNSLSLQNLIDIARAHGKPFGMAETGAGGTNGAPVDDPAFPQWLATTLTAAASSGVKIAFANVWDISPGDGDWRFSDPAAGKPLEAAAWAKYLGVGAQGVAIPVTVGSGADVIVLHVSEDAYLGDARFTVSVDGVQVGGVLTAQQSHASGMSQGFNLHGSFGPGAHKVAVTFINDAWGGTAATDRNLYVDRLDMGPTAMVTTGAAGMLASNGSRSFTLDPDSTVTVGSGTGRIVLHMSGDAYAGNPMFNVRVDGTQIGGNLSVAASHAAGQTQDFVLLGNFAAGLHQVAVSFINDAWGGAAGADRNLYVTGIDVGGTAQNLSAGLFSNATKTFAVNATAAASTATVLGSGPDSIGLSVSEDAWQGDAQFTVRVDGKQIGGVQTATAAHAAGATQAFTVLGNFAGGAHDLAISFINDAWGGDGADRNLFVDQVSYGGATKTQVASLWSNGTAGLSLKALPASATALVPTTMATASDAFLGGVTLS